MWLVFHPGHEAYVDDQQTSNKYGVETEATFLGMATVWLVPQFQDNIANFILQLYGTTPHWSAKVRDYLDEHLPHRWIGCRGQQHGISPMALRKS
ncbi:hypothetical protein TNCV_1583361 [Trichonephila clavipes]|nr:hypothetical protein TNCV_1583361 [Trichonephila clavipes]